MTLSRAIRAINCTNCGAGLDVLGGGRVSTHVCPYCGAALDAQDNYRVIARYDRTARPDSPLRLGMSGQINGVTFTVIGSIAWVERYAGREWVWVDHQVFSPSHGYAWLTVEDGHLIFSRRYRKPTEPDFITSATVERSENRPTVRTEADKYTYYETSTAVITYAEGEFNWTPKVGDRATAVSLLGDEDMLSFEQSATEREVELSRWLPSETYAEFGAEAPARVSRNHPLMPYKNLRLPRFYLLAAALLAVLAVIVGLGLSTRQGVVVARLPAVPISTLPVELSFTLSDTEKLTQVAIETDVSNSWAYIEVALNDPDDRPVFEAGREIGFYHGRDGDGAWSEGSRNSTLQFHAPRAGNYLLELAISESGTWQRSGAALDRISVTVTEGRSSGLWLYLLAGGFLLVPGLVLLRYSLANKRRWSGSDWVDEDDDDDD